LKESIDDFQLVYYLLLAQRRNFHFQKCLKLFLLVFKVNAHQQFLDGFRTDFGFKIIVQFISNFIIFVYIYQFHLFIGAVSGIDNDVRFVIKNSFQIFNSHIQKYPDFTGSTFNEPNMRDRNGQFNMPHSGATHARRSYQNTTTVTDRILEAFLLIFTASAFVISFGTEDAFTKQTVFFRFKSTIIQSIRLCYFSVAPFIANNIRRSKLYSYPIIGLSAVFFMIVFHASLLLHFIFTQELNVKSQGFELADKDIKAFRNTRRRWIFSAGNSFESIVTSVHIVRFNSQHFF